MHIDDKSEIHPPWYRQFWPWVLIAIPLLTVIASGFTFWLAVSNPDYLVVDDEQYQKIRNELKVQEPADEKSKAADEAPEDGDGPP